MHTAPLNPIASRLLIVTTLLATLLLGALLAVTPTKATPSEPFLVKTVGRCEKAQTVAAGERYFFIGNDAEHGCELWVSDGTEAGTRLVKDIWPGPNSGVGAEFAPPTLTNVNGIVYFMAHDGTHGYELWKSDGTAAGTTQVKDIKVGECVGSWSIWDDGCSSFAGWNGLAVLGNTLFFIADDNESTLELWRTDGTAPGTVRLTTMGANAPVTAGTFVFFIGSGETLWRSDGTPDGTILLRDGLSSLHLTPMVAVGDRLFFAASDGSGTRGVELWSSDGTREGTGIVRDIRPGLYASRPFELTAMGNWLYFMIEGETHYELWRSDGSEAGTVQMAVTPMPVGGYVPSDLTAVGNQLYFSAIDEPQGNYKLWKSDSSAAGTQLVTDRVSNPTALTAFNDLLIFSGYDDTHGYELWQSDGTDAMTFMVKEFCEGTILSPWDPCHGGPSEITKVGERVFMHAYPSYRNAALYTYVPRNELPVTPTATASPTAATPTPSATASPTTTPTPSPVIQPSLPQISAGTDFTCAIDYIGRLNCWGIDNRPQVPLNLGVATQVDVGSWHFCVIHSDGILNCLGYLWGQGGASVPDDLGPVSQVSAGSQITCAITRAGTLRCWTNIYGSRDQEMPDDLGNVSQVSVSGHRCAITSAGVLRCWGYDTYGQATVPADLGPVNQVSAGGEHTCAITNAGLVRCWGYNTYGQATVPTDLGPVSQVSAGGRHTCAITNSGIVRCWGDDSNGEATVPADLGPVSQVSAGEYYTCAVTRTGTMRCWGRNGSGQSSIPSAPIDPAISSNYADGAPGSSFLIRGIGFPSEARLRLTINGVRVGDTLTADTSGRIILLLQTTATAAEGRYRVELTVEPTSANGPATVEASSADTGWLLANGLTLREPPTGVEAPAVTVPASIAAGSEGVFFPVVRR